MRLSTPLLVALLTGLAALPSCAQPTSTGLYTPTQPRVSAAEREASDAEAAVRGAVEGLMAADNNGDADLAASFYATDAVLLPPEAEPLVGSQVIRNHYVSLFSRHTMTVTARSHETLVFGDVAIDRGIVTGTLQPHDGAPAALNDQYLMVLRRDTAGRWRVFRVMWGPAATAGRLPG